MVIEKTLLLGSPPCQDLLRCLTGQQAIEYLTSIIKQNGHDKTDYSDLTPDQKITLACLSNFIHLNIEELGGCTHNLFYALTHALNILGSNNCVTDCSPYPAWLTIEGDHDLLYPLSHITLPKNTVYIAGLIKLIIRTEQLLSTRLTLQEFTTILKSQDTQHIILTKLPSDLTQNPSNDLVEIFIESLVKKRLSNHTIFSLFPSAMLKWDNGHHIKKYLQNINWLFLNKDELMAIISHLAPIIHNSDKYPFSTYTKIKNFLSTILSDCGTHFIITDGKKPVIHFQALHRSNIEYFSPASIDDEHIVSTVGAGDAYSGTLIAAIINNLSLRDACVLAGSLATQVLTQPQATI